MKSWLMSVRYRSYREVEGWWRQGCISRARWEAFCWVWCWSAPRFGGAPGRQHDVFWSRWGKAAYYRRISRVRRAFGHPEL